jgi:hypothetical protein
MVTSILISSPLMSGNYYSGRHWKLRHKMRKMYEKEIWACCNGKVPKFSGKVEVAIVSQRAHLLDPDNLYSGCKPLLDAMKQLEIIEEDSPKYLDLNVSQSKSKKDCISILIRGNQKLKTNNQGETNGK